MVAVLILYRGRAYYTLRSIRLARVNGNISKLSPELAGDKNLCFRSNSSCKNKSTTVLLEHPDLEESSKDPL